MQDAINREITIKADVQRVYKAIADPEQMIKWFPEEIEGTLGVGQQVVMSFKGHGKSSVLVVAANPFEYFAYRWIPGGANIVDDLMTVPTTLVEFHLEDLGPETKVTLKESGFASLPAEVAERSFNQNSGGWEYMLSRLEKAIG